MGFFSEYQKAKKEAELKFQKKHPILAALSKNDNNNKKQNDNKKKPNLKKRMDLYDLSEEERRAVLEEGYEPEDFEDDELEEDDYYYDEKT
jgi:hypothetical protein